MSKKFEINILNYESFVIDYLEGNLSNEEVACFEEFLESYPELKEDIDNMDLTVIVPDQVEYKQKNSLKKKQVIAVGDINENNYENVFIASFENDLTKEQESMVDDFVLKNHHLKKEYNLHGKLVAEPDYSITFSGKDKLRMRRNITIRYSSIAAAVILIITSVWFFRLQKNDVIRNQSTYLTQINYRNTVDIDLSTLPGKFSIVDRFQKTIPESQSSATLETPELLYTSRITTRSSTAELVTASDFKRIISKQYQPAVIQYIPESNNTSKKGNRLFASVLKKQWDNLIAGINPNQTKKEKSNDPTYVQVIDTGIKVFNTITGSQTTTSKSYNSEGELTGYQVEGREVLLNRNIHSGSAE